MTARTVVTISAGLSQPSSTRLLADQLTVATTRSLGAHEVEATTRVIELREHATGLANHLLTGFPAAGLRAALEHVQSADGLIVVSPIFNASYSGLFKTFVDVLDRDALRGTPVLLAATGGTARHSLALEHALRPLFAYLQAVTVPTAVYAATEDWGTGSVGDTGSALRERVERAARELATMVAVQPASRAADPFADPTAFADLLVG